MEELANIDTIKDRIKDRIQTEFVSLIPEEAWSNLVAKEVEWFTTAKGENYASTAKPSPLQTLVRCELESRFKEQISKTLSDMRGGWNRNGRSTPSDAVTKMVKEIAPELWELAVAGVVQQAIDGFRNSLGQNNY